MAFTGYHNVTGSTGVHVELLAPGDNAGDVKSIMLTNIHATADATVSLSIAKLSSSSITSAETYYILHTIAIPADTSLVLEGADIPTIPAQFGTYITVGSSDTVDVLINI